MKKETTLIIPSLCCCGRRIEMDALKQARSDER
jgi:hypothetical protein